MTDYKNELDVALSEYFTWRGEAIHEVNQTENYKRLLTKLEALLSKRELEARLSEVKEFSQIFDKPENFGAFFTKGWVKSYTDDRISQLTNREEK